MDFKLLKQKFKDNYKTFDLDFNEKYVLYIVLNRKKSMNSCNFDFFNDFIDVFSVLRYNNYKDIRVIIIKSSFENFCSGLDLKNTAPILIKGPEKDDQARKSIGFINIIKVLQKAFFSIEDCNIPVISLVKGFCIGGGIDLILACDIVIADETSKFSIKEANIGLAADLGTLQRLPIFTKNWGLMNDLIYTGRFFDSKEAKKVGIVSFIEKNIENKKNEIVKGILNNSPVAVFGTKLGVNNYKKNVVYKGLEFMKYLNMSLLHTDDIPLSVKKEGRIFPKL